TEDGARVRATSGESSGQGSFARLLPWLLAVLAALVAAWALRLRSAPDTAAFPVQQFDITYPADVEPAPYINDNTLALSPDGRSVAMIGVRHGARSLFVRRLESAEVVEISEPDGLNAACFSPDGAKVALISPGRGIISRSLADRQRTIVTTNATDIGALAWGEAGIVFTRNGRLWIAPKGMGEARPLTALDASRHEVLHTGAVFLAGG